MFSTWLVATIIQSTFSFVGITLSSNIDDIAARYPKSHRADQYIYVDPADSHDHISGIEISGEVAGAARRVRIAFEQKGVGDRPVYPVCTAVQSTLQQKFGRPTTVRRFNEEASLRSDRIWTSRTEVLTLLCFAGSDGRWFAEAVQITRRGAGEP